MHAITFLVIIILEPAVYLSFRWRSGHEGGFSGDLLSAGESPGLAWRWARGSNSLPKTGRRCVVGGMKSTRPGWARLYPMDCRPRDMAAWKAPSTGEATNAGDAPKMEKLRG